MFLVFSIIHFPRIEPDFKRLDCIYNDDNLCLQKAGVERKNSRR